MPLGSSIQAADRRGFHQASFGDQTQYRRLASATAPDRTGKNQGLTGGHNSRSRASISSADPARGSRSRGDLGGAAPVIANAEKTRRCTNYRFGPPGYLGRSGSYAHALGTRGNVRSDPQVLRRNFHLWPQRALRHGRSVRTESVCSEIALRRIRVRPGAAQKPE